MSFHPLTADRWPDLERLFGPRGAVGGCWCMWWRLKHSEYERNKGEPNKLALKRIVESGEPPGLLAYVDGQPIGWCSVGPRDGYPRFDTSRILKPVDDQPVWSIVCLFVAKDFRRSGISIQLLRAAVEHARAQGARIVESYPVVPKKPDMPSAFAFTGIASAYRQAGFEEVLRRSETRPIMRYYIEEA